MTKFGTLIVTGGGRGIGAATALLAARTGFAVAVNYAKDGTSAERLVTGIRAEGGTAVAIQADVAVEADVLRLFETAEERLGPLGALVNNAGVTGGIARVEDVDAATLQRVFAVNITGAFLCAREAVRRLSTLRGGDGGSIVNVSSRAAVLGGSGDWVHYAASKGALDTLTVGLAKEVADQGVRVNGVAPGVIDTELHAEAGKPDRARDLAPRIPMRRPGQPDEVAHAIMWLLASPGASYITGTTLAVSGGG